MAELLHGTDVLEPDDPSGVVDRQLHQQPLPDRQTIVWCCQVETNWSLIVPRDILVVALSIVRVVGNMEQRK